MTPIPARSGAERHPAPERTPGVRRGRHRKPRPRKVLFAAGGLALAAGVLGLVRVTPEPGAGGPGTAEAEPRLEAGGTAPDHSGNTSATLAAAPTALPSATSVMGGRSLVPAPAGSPARTAPHTAPPTPGHSAVPTAAPAETPDTHGTPRPGPTASAPRPAPTPARTPTPSRTPAEPEAGGVCVPVIGLCVDVPDGD
ncbi:hypothetical protein KBP30_16395 [Streptomyces sp. Go40/10]|uniref:hypothetical protein n=1 Tax=Streptomyces sp. Go40/10 TaxID=2825844 RepID=UPI001E375B51|nr:hypothetical protein [Streptomyces sp. Go40/10]UFR02666.1 hypothetical protein KBP30_16395 [Streptomyces sp. Go40/10]